MSGISTWFEGAILSIFIVVLFGFAIGSMNTKYNQGNTLDIADTSTQNAIQDYIDSSTTQIQEGDTASSSQGFSLLTAAKLVKDAIVILWNFVTGSWFTKVGKLWNLGDAGTTIVRVFITLGLFSLIYTGFKLLRGQTTTT